MIIRIVSKLLTFDLPARFANQWLWSGSLQVSSRTFLTRVNSGAQTGFQVPFIHSSINCDRARWGPWRRRVLLTLDASPSAACQTSRGWSRSVFMLTYVYFAGLSEPASAALCQMYSWSLHVWVTRPRQHVRQVFWQLLRPLFHLHTCELDLARCTVQAGYCLRREHKQSLSEKHVSAHVGRCPEMIRTLNALWQDCVCYSCFSVCHISGCEHAAGDRMIQPRVLDNKRRRRKQPSLE